MKIVYFASLRRQIGLAEETIDPPPAIDRLGSLLDWLKTRSPAHLAALGGCQGLMMAVNHDYANAATPVAAGDEVAFFPPVTGG